MKVSGFLLIDKKYEHSYEELIQDQHCRFVYLCPVVYHQLAFRTDYFMPIGSRQSKVQSGVTIYRYPKKKTLMYYSLKNTTVQFLSNPLLSVRRKEKVSLLLWAESYADLLGMAHNKCHGRLLLICAWQPVLHAPQKINREDKHCDAPGTFELFILSSCS